MPDVRLVYAPPRVGGRVRRRGRQLELAPPHGRLRAAARLGRSGRRPGAATARGPSPYRPRHFFPVSAQGVGAGRLRDGARAIPAVTFRSLTAAEMRERAERCFPGRAELYRAWIDLMEAASARDEAARIALADRMKALANREKNSRGQVAGIRRGQHPGEEGGGRAGDPRLGGRPARAGGGGRRRTTELAQADGGACAARGTATSCSTRRSSGPKPLDLALTLVRWAGEKAKPDLEREPDYMEREPRPAARAAASATRSASTSRPRRRCWPTSCSRYAALPEGSRVPAVEALLGERPHAGRGARARAAELLAGTKVTDLGGARRRCSRRATAQLQARRDPLLDLAFALDRELRSRKEREDRYQGRHLAPAPALAAGGDRARRPSRWRRTPTARCGSAFGARAGLQPARRGAAEPQTTVAGIVAKHTGEEPFDAPEAVLAAAPAAPESRWADPSWSDVPVAFLADADTTGGNSGSPVLNGRGELVGVNFDRVWENVANDFGYNPEVAQERQRGRALPALDAGGAARRGGAGAAQGDGGAVALLSGALVRAASWVAW